MRPGVTLANNGRIRWLPLLAGLAALGQHASWTAWMPPAPSSPFAAAHRVRHRVLRSAPIVRLAAKPALAPGFAQADVHVVGIADHADGRPAIGRHAPDFAGRQRYLRPVRLTRAEYRADAGTPAQLAAAARPQLDVVYAHAQRNIPEWHAVPHARFGRGTVHHLIA